MGLFDQYQFDQGSYGGGSLIDRLLSQLQTQGQYQPSQGFAPNPMDANAQMQPQPIAVGNYQMPRMGTASQFIPDPAALPQNAQPTQGMTPQQYAAMPVSSRVPQQGSQYPQQQQDPLPSFLQPAGNGPGDRLMAGLQNFSGGGSLLHAIAGGITGLSTGRRTDPQGMQQEALQAQYRSLIPILGEQKARLAVINPEMGKAMVAQALAGKQYQFTTAPDGTVIRTDAHAGTAEPVYQAGLKPTFGVVGEDDGKKTYGWTDPAKRTVTPYQAPGGGETNRTGIAGPDGKIIPYPEGADAAARKTFANEIAKINADSAGGKKTEVQAKSEKFGNQMELAERNIKGLENEYTSTIGAGGFFRGTEYLPGGNALQSESYQKFLQARDSFLTALLRDESGAAIGSAEFNRREKEMFPQPGDSPGTVERKAKLRAVAVEGMKKAAGPGYKSPDFAAEDAAKADIDSLLKKYGGK
jgi:hypothetical protein